MSLLKDYETFVIMRDKTGKEKSENLRCLHYISGIASEFGEVAALHQKTVRAGGAVSEINKDLLKEEIGDLLWYITALIKFHGLELEDIIQTNIEKLLERHKQEESL